MRRTAAGLWAIFALGTGAAAGAHLGTVSAATTALRVRMSGSHSAAARRNVARASGADRSLPDEYDLAVLGAGPTGVTAAVAASQRGRRVIVIDDPGSGAKLQVGGPSGLFSKALRDVSKRIQVSTLRSMGLLDTSIWAQVQSMCKEIALVETQNTVRKLQRSGVPRIQGAAAFSRTHDDGSLEVRCRMRDGTGLLVRAHNVLVATGSSAWPAPGIPLDGRRVFDSDSINRLTYMPKSVIITGSGIIAIEFAKIFAALDSHVTLLVRGDRLDSCLERFGMDGGFAGEVEASLAASNIEILFNAEVDASSFVVPASLAAPLSVRITQKGQQEALVREACLYMLAAGRDANTAHLNLDAVGASVDGRGNLEVDSRLCTANPRVYGAGDVLGPPSLASTGVEQATAAVRAMFPAGNEELQEAMEGGGVDPTALLSDKSRFPVGIWTTPEMAYFGLSPAQAVKDGRDVVEGVAKYADTLRGHVNRCSIGSLKLVVSEDDGAILGVFIFGDEACELVHYGMELVVGARTVFDVQNTLFAAVTFHECYKNAADDAVAQLAAKSSPAFRRYEAVRM